MLVNLQVDTWKRDMAPTEVHCQFPKDMQANAHAYAFTSKQANARRTAY